MGKIKKDTNIVARKDWKKENRYENKALEFQRKFKKLVVSGCQSGQYLDILNACEWYDDAHKQLFKNTVGKLITLCLQLSDSGNVGLSIGEGQLLVNKIIEFDQITRLSIENRIIFPYIIIPDFIRVIIDFRAVFIGYMDTFWDDE